MHPEGITNIGYMSPSSSGGYEIAWMHPEGIKVDLFSVKEEASHYTWGLYVFNVFINQRIKWFILWWY
jgi:hypothetical protein